jgi:hypothetical protein
LTFFAAAKASSSFPPPDLPEIAFAGPYFELSSIFYACFILVKKIFLPMLLSTQ